MSTWSIDVADHVTVVAPSPGGALVALGSLGGDAVIVGAGTGELVAKLDDHPMGVLAGAWSPDGNRLAVGGQDGVLRVYRSDPALAAAVPLGGWVTSLAWSPDGALLAAGAGRTLTVLDPAGAVVRRYADQPSTVTAVSWSPDGRRVGVTAYGGVRWYDPATDDDGPDQRPARIFAWKGSLLSLAVSPTGKWACGGAQDSTVHIWRLWSGSDLSMSGYRAKIEHLGFRHDGHWLAVACLDELTIWPFTGKGPAGARPARGEAHDRHIAALAWAPGGDRLVTGGAEGRVALWPAPSRAGRTLRPHQVHEHDTSVAALAWLGTTGRLVVGYADGRAQCVGGLDDR